jgi:hypothetical protein
VGLLKQTGLKERKEREAFFMLQTPMRVGLGMRATLM